MGSDLNALFQSCQQNIVCVDFGFKVQIYVTETVLLSQKRKKKDVLANKTRLATQ